MNDDLSGTEGVRSVELLDKTPEKWGPRMIQRERERDWHQGFHVEMEYTILPPLKVNTPLLFCSVLAPCAPYALVHSASAAAHGFSPKT